MKVQQLQVVHLTFSMHINASIQIPNKNSFRTTYRHESVRVLVRASALTFFRSHTNPNQMNLFIYENTPDLVACDMILVLVVPRSFWNGATSTTWMLNNFHSHQTDTDAMHAECNAVVVTVTAADTIKLDGKYIRAQITHTSQFIEMRSSFT